MTGARQRPVIAYVTGLYPKVSHTFIQREVIALRKLGLDVRTYSIRRAQPATTRGAQQAAEAASTFVILDAAGNPFRLCLAHLRQIAHSPFRWLSALRLAFITRSPGLRSLLWHLFYLAEAGVLADHARRSGITQMHNHFGDASATVTMLASEMTGIPFSMTLHGPTVFLEPRRWRLDMKIARSRFVACISQFCRSQAMLFSDERDWGKLHVVHCGIDPALYVQGRCQGAKIVFVGRLDPVKGVSLLLDAFAEIRRRHPDATLTLAGDGPARESLEHRCHGLGLSDCVTFTGFIDETAVADLLNASDLFVLASFAEGLPVVLMEAMATGLPVVASQIAGIPELVRDGENGLLIPAGDTASLIAAIDRLLSDPDLGRDMGRNGRAAVLSDFNIDTESRRLARLFNDPHAPG